MYHEYRITTITVSNVGELANRLTEESGLRGWELVTIQPDMLSSAYICIMRKQVVGSGVQPNPEEGSTE